MIDWAGFAFPKGPTKLDTKIAKVRDDDKSDASFKAAVWKRDQNRCRVCRKHVVKSLELTAKRGEVHHLEKRRDQAVRFDPRNGLLCCAVCHAKLEQHVLVIYGQDADRFTVNGRKYLNADATLEFKAQ